LKNFISIQDFLSNHGPSEFRMFCLLHKYSSNVNYSEDRIQDAVNVLKKINEAIAISEQLGSQLGAKCSSKLTRGDVSFRNG